MNHQPYRGWLLSDVDLSVEQTDALHEHLRTCDSCSRLESSWKELESAFSRFPQLDPAPGFVERWQVRLVEQQKYQQRQRGWYIIGSTTLIVISLLVVTVIQLWSLIQAPAPYLAAWFNRLVGVVSIYFTIQNYVSSFSLPNPVYTLAGMVLLFGMISFMSVLWLATFRKISMVWRSI